MSSVRQTPNSMRILTSFLVLTVALCFSGCIAFPYKYTKRQETSGVLIDGDSRRPVAGASITLSSQYEEPISVLSKKDGSFVVPNSRFWSLFMVGMHYPFISWSLTVTAPGYQTHTDEFGFSMYKNKPIQLGSIILKKESPKNCSPPEPIARALTPQCPD